MSTPEPISDERRRVLTKKARAPPPQSTSSAAPDSSSAHPLRRAPSAPIRSRDSAHAHASPAQHTRSPTLDPTWTNTSSYAANARLQPYQPRSVTEKSSADLLGQRFDSAAVIQSFNAVPYSSAPHPAQLRAAPPPVPQQSPYTVQQRPASLSQAKTTGHSLSPELAQSFQAATGRRMEDIRGARQRYSDEVRENKVLKKKSGFSSFFNLSSPRKPTISAPENPVHVTHVGYDQETGEFTVRRAEFKHLIRAKGICDALDRKDCESRRDAVWSRIVTSVGSARTCLSEQKQLSNEHAHADSQTRDSRKNGSAHYRPTALPSKNRGSTRKRSSTS